MSKAWELDIPTNEKMLLLALCDHANDDGVCYPSYDKLQNKCSFASRSTISANLKRLEAKNIIKKKIRNQSVGGRKTTVYTIDLEAQSTVAGLEPKVQLTIAQSTVAVLKPLDNRQGKENIKEKAHPETGNSKEPLKPVDIITFYRQSISDKHSKIKETESYNLLAKKNIELPLVLNGLKNYLLPADEKYITSLPKFIENKIYLDYQKAKRSDKREMEGFAI